MSEAAFDVYFMKMALREAQKAAEDGETPLGCVLVAPAILEPAHDGHPAVYDFTPLSARILARSHNQVEGLADATAHAEMLAVSAACAATGNWRLSGTRLYVTKEPCPMCAGACVLSRVETIVWGLSDPKRGGGTVFDLFRHAGMNHHPRIVTGVCEDEARDVLVSFFRDRRNRG